MKRSTNFLYGVFLFVVACGVPMPDQEETPGGCGPYRAIKYYDEVHDFAGKHTELIRLSAFHVESDGTLDPYAEYGGGATYVFVRPTPALEPKPKKPRKIGTPEEPEEPGEDQEPLPYEQVIVKIQQSTTVVIYQDGGEYTQDQGGMVRSFRQVERRERVAPKPTCRFSKLWKRAQEVGVPSNAVAEISYDVKGYRFQIEEIDVDLRFDYACNIVEPQPPELGEILTR